MRGPHRSPIDMHTSSLGAQLTTTGFVHVLSSKQSSTANPGAGGSTSRRLAGRGRRRRTGAVCSIGTSGAFKSMTRDRPASYAGSSSRAYAPRTAYITSV